MSGGLLRRLAENPLTGFLAVTLLYASSLRGLIAIQEHQLRDNPGPIHVLEIGVTALYLAAALFLLYIMRGGRKAARTPAASLAA